MIVRHAETFLTSTLLGGTIGVNNAHQGYARRKAGTLKLVGFFFLGGRG